MKLEDLIGCIIVASSAGRVAVWNGDETLFLVDGLGLVVDTYRPLVLRSERPAERLSVAKLAAQRWLARMDAPEAGEEVAL